MRQDTARPESSRNKLLLAGSTGRINEELTMYSKSINSLMFVVISLIASGSTVEAGPLLDWLRNKCNRNGGNVVVGGYTATSGTFTQAPTTLQPGQCQRTCMQTCQRTTVNYVPYTAYRTEWQRVPVTQYRPVTNTDPCSGCTVTCMRPCTSYSWQLQRKPYTTYRPVYQTQSYRVPVTTITNDCATGNCNSCSTCGVPAATGNIAPAAGGFVPSTGTAADGIPTLNSSNRPYYGVYDSYPVPSGYQSYTIPAQSSTYANPQAYSGISQYSGYSVPTTNVYTPPMPSSLEAPQPAFDSGYNSGSAPADQTPILNNNPQSLQNPAGSANPAVRSVLSNGQEAQPLLDPTPDQRWDFNVPQLGRPADQSAMNEVQVRWAYTPTNGATYSDAVPAAVAEGSATSTAPRVNDLWQSTGNPRVTNGDWN